MNQIEKKTLHLTLKKKYFEAILSNTKTAEYRKYTQYWKRRLLNKDGSFKNFDFVQFKNGYHKSAPIILVEFKSMKIVKSKTNWFIKKKYFEIELGKMIKVNNIEYNK